MIEQTRLSETHSLTVDATVPRQTPSSPGRRFAEALGNGVDALVRTAGQGGALVPGGALLSAAVREVGGSAGGAVAGQRPEGPGGTAATGGALAEGDPMESMWRIQQQSQEFNLQYLQLQEGLAQENRRFSAVSNVLRARHETSRAVIQNLR
jgi:hypothetical protein